MPDLINTLEAPGEFDALATLRPGEPYFLLVGRDRTAPPLIYDWADKNRRRALAEFGDGKITKAKCEDELRKSTQAEEIAASMVEYKNGWAEQQIERPTAEAITGVEVPEETDLRDKLQAARSRAASAMRNAHAELVDLQELLDPESLLGEVGLSLTVANLVEHLSDSAGDVAPPRPGINP